MYTDKVLEEKWATQKILAKNANYRIDKLVENAHKSALELSNISNVPLKYSKRKGGYIKPDSIP